jgi:hypothetical protein
VIDVQRSFFRTALGGRANREVRVSAAFAACFRESRLFRQVVLDVLADSCIGARRVKDTTAWTCDTEVLVTTGGRVDLVLRSEKHRSPVFRIENKVEAPLSKAQVRRYRKDRDGSYLVALTKYPPEPASLWLRQHGCHAVRWQQLHRTLTNAKPRNRVDRFLFTNFCSYLEELGMAHPERVTTTDLSRLHRFFIATTTTKSQISADVFATAQACIGVLDDVIDAALDNEPRLAEWNRSGPTYWKHTEKDWGVWHQLGFSFHDRSWKREFGGCFVFPNVHDEDPYWDSYIVNVGTYDERSHWFGRLIDRTGALDPGRLAKSFLDDCSKLGVRLSKRR